MGLCTRNRYGAHCLLTTLTNNSSVKGTWVRVSIYVVNIQGTDLGGYVTKLNDFNPVVTIPETSSLINDGWGMTNTDIFFTHSGGNRGPAC